MILSLQSLHRAFILTVLSSALPYINTSSAQTKSANHIKSSQALFPGLKAHDAIVQDGPVTDMLFLDEQRLALITTSSLWIWTLPNTQVKRIKLTGETPPHALTTIAKGNDHIWVASAKTLFHINWRPFKVTAFEAPTASLALGVFPQHKQLIWVRQNDTIILDRSSGAIKTSIYPQKAHTKAKPIAAHFYNPSKRVFLLYPDHILQLPIDSAPEKISSSILAKSEIPFRNLANDHDTYFVFTPYSVIRMKGAQVLQTIPVVSERRLVLMETTAQQHAFLFSDKTLEINDLSTRETAYFNLGLGRVKKASSLRILKSRVALIVDGRPMAFRLEKSSKDV